MVKQGSIEIKAASNRLELLKSQSFITNGNMQPFQIVAGEHKAIVKLISFDMEMLFSLKLPELLLLNVHFWVINNKNKYFVSDNANIFKAEELLEKVLENNCSNPMNDETLLCVFKVMVYEATGLLKPLSNILEIQVAS